MKSSKTNDPPPRKSLIRWYDCEKRDLPWRKTNDPWLILLSEVILQQTQVSRGIEYWKKISNRFPTPESLAKADLDNSSFSGKGQDTMLEQEDYTPLLYRYRSRLLKEALTAPFPDQKNNFCNCLE